ncbi:cytosolic Fe-S cluster assembly factor narfl-like isoform X1 [Oppia nitens]|uniref:cytosolic Fe-S cluster assembly factor narfl-like isoform X1 n=1 Tax=Oppia nitens TaxID=1686743 RepID=UPI0023D9E0B5|nr:cytosolic Fe-S cluster assembly factor narfl-like isoform X1 [Oppia nitens]
MATSSGFSSALKIADLNDFITPSQACIKPIENNKEIKSNVKTNVNISLSDCLACSGCITSAETVLIEQQSYEELYRIINFNKNNESKRRTIVMSMSLQSIASIAAKHHLDMETTSRKLSDFFHNLGVDYILDISLARHFSIIEAQNEFLDQFNKNEFPVLSSICPGFVCYAEKTHGDLIIPFLSRVKSAQQIMGILVKQFLNDKQINASHVFHITLMPCYDKKLEATRNGTDFSHINADNFKEVDCVLTPIEIEIMLNRENVIFTELNERLLDKITGDPNDQMVSHLGSGSGGYAENIFRFMASKYFEKYYKCEQQLDYKVNRNKDFIDLTLEDESGNKLLSFAIINGFRNIQTLVQRIKRKTCDYQYVEVMACPSGCLNGGAQLRPESVDDMILERVDQLYRSLPITSLALDGQHQEIITLYDKYFPNKNISKLYTTFKAVPKTKNLINIKW